MHRLLAFALILSALALRGQQDMNFVDDKYLEDQLYIDLTYISLVNTPSFIDQSGFSFGFGGGFIKDIPLNKRRNFGLGVGLGYGFNNYYFDYLPAQVQPPAGEMPDSNDPADLSPIYNKIMLHTAEVPIELRFRTSTPTKYRFWRFYPGFKLSYVFLERLRLGERGDIDVGDLIEANDLLYGLTFNGGYNKWNLMLYYGLNELFNDKRPEAANYDIHDLRVGLVFYMF